MRSTNYSQKKRVSRKTLRGGRKSLRRRVRKSVRRYRKSLRQRRRKSLRGGEVDKERIELVFNEKLKTYLSSVNKEGLINHSSRIDPLRKIYIVSDNKGEFLGYIRNYVDYIKPFPVDSQKIIKSNHGVNITKGDLDNASGLFSPGGINLEDFSNHLYSQ